MKILMFAGGSGTRLWPVSRKSKPKQFQKIIGDKTFIQACVGILRKEFGIENIFISSPKKFEDIIKKQIKDLPLKNLILEPSSRDTLACVGYAYYKLNSLYPNENILTLWSDFTIKHKDSFVNLIKKADKYASKSNKVVKIDVNPYFPYTNLGYIKVGNLVENFEGFEVYEFLSQIEKPDEKTAREFLESTRYLWHTGINMWPKCKLMELYKEFRPDIYSVYEKMDGSNDESLYESIPKISIDYGLFQNVSPSYFIEMPGDLGWRDVGTWESVYEELSHDKDENISDTKTHFIDSARNILLSKTGKRICTIGVKDFVLVETEDVIFLSPIKESRRLKDLIKIIEENDQDIL